MIIIYLLLIPIIYIIVKLLLYYLISKFSKRTNDGFKLAGFTYNSKEDVFFTDKNAWQRKFGYCHLYDILAPIFRIIIDTETIKFKYNNKNYLVNFWKGQYGIVTGAEIGIYYTSEKYINKKTLYLPLSNKDLLDMNFTLYKKGQKISKVRDRHWWIGIFKLGMFSQPKELTMDIKITFPNKDMLKSFLKSFIKKGYDFKDFTIVGNTFKFIYKKPKTKKVWTRNYIIDKSKQYWNKNQVLLYNNFLADLIDDSITDIQTNDNQKLLTLNNYIPEQKSNQPKKDIKKKAINPTLIAKKNPIFLNDKVLSDKRNYHG